MTTVKSMTRSSTHRLVGVAAIVGVTALGLVGCSVTKNESTDGWSASIPAPIAIDAATVAGTTVTIPLDNSAYIIVPDGTETDYRARVNGEAVTFVAGSSDNGLVLRPGLTAQQVGDSRVELVNAKDGAITLFTVHVE